MRGALIAAVAAVLASAPAAAQNTTVIPETFSLPPGNSQATPTPTPAPATLPTPVAVPTFTPAPPPSVVPSLPVTRPGGTPTPSIAPTRTPGVTPAPAPTPRGTPSPAATPGVVGAPAVLPDAPAPEASQTAVPPIAEPTAEPSPEPTPAGDGPPAWLWWLAGIVALGAVGAFAWRRMAARRAEPIAYDPQPAADVAAPPPTPSPPARPVGRSAAAPRAPVAPPSDRGLLLDFRPQRMWTRGPDAFLAFELVVTNTTGEALDGIRPAIALASAGPETAAEVAAFRAGAASLPTGEPFDLRAGETRSVAGELTLPGGAMYVTTVADREMIVPLALVALRWRAGVALASLAEAFVIGTGDAASPRLGPIWVDRAGQVYPRLDARRFATPGG